MNESIRDRRDAPGPRDAWWLVLTMYSALLLRGAVPYRTVFAGDYVRFQGSDAWYHMRLIDHLVRNFPWRLSFDPYAYFPAGQAVSVAPLFDFAVALAAWIAGLGSPSQHTVEAVAAWFPPVLGALTLIPVYFIGRLAFDAKVGLIAAGLLALQPGQFLMRSLLGFVDHHVAETLLSSLTVWLLLAAVEDARSEGGSGGRPTLARIRAALPAGLALGSYLLCWGGGALFVALLTGWTVVQQVLDHLRGRSSAYLHRVIPPVALTALATLAPFAGVLPRAELHVASLVLFLTTPYLLAGIVRGLELAGRGGLPRSIFPATVAAALGVGAAALYLAAPSLAQVILANLRRFLPSTLGTTVTEAAPLLFERGAFTLVPVWLQYRWTFVLGGLGLLILVRLAVRDATPARTLLLTWSLAMTAATLGQNRFGYYLAVNLALLSALLCRTVLAPLDAASKLSAGRARLRGLATAAVALLAFVPTVEPSLAVARTEMGPAPEWFEALSWMRERTPEPLGDPQAYFDRYPRSSRDAPFPYPRTAYGVMSWWDYGYRITRIARRIPNANPTQNGAGAAARFYTATDAEEAARILDEAGSRYVIVNFDLITWSNPGTAAKPHGMFYAMASWAGRDLSRYYEVYWQTGDTGTPEPVLVYYPAYYESMAVRLYYYAGTEVVPEDSTWVISYRERTVPGGTVKEIVDTHLFAVYEDALAFLEEQSEGNWRLVGLDPLFPCVPLDPLPAFREVYHSPQARIAGPGFALPEIRILEYGGPGK